MELLDGIDIVLVAVGLFAVAEVLYAAIYEGSVNETQNKMSRVHMTVRDWKRSWPAWLRGTLIGTPFGCIPAGGTEIHLPQLRHRGKAGPRARTRQSLGQGRH